MTHSVIANNDNNRRNNNNNNDNQNNNNQVSLNEGNLVAMQMETGGRKRRSPLGLEGRALAMAPWSVAQIAVRMKLCHSELDLESQSVNQSVSGGLFCKGFGDEGRRISSRLSRVAAGSDRVADRREILGQTPPAAVVRARLPLPPSKEYLRLRFGIIPSWSDGKSRRKGAKVR